MARAMADTDVIELPPLYYRDNFLRLCSSVDEQYGDILLPQERSMLEAFTGLPVNAQCLYVRLASRTGPWFRESKLNYPEIGTIAPALDRLLDAHFLDNATQLSPADAASLFTLPELRRAFADHLDNIASVPKGQLVSDIEALELDDEAIHAVLQSSEPGRIVAPAHLRLVDTLCVLFFGNRHQSLTEFVLEDLGVVRYYPYQLQRRQRVFENREALDEYLACAALSDLHYEVRENPSTQKLVELADAALSVPVAHAAGQQRWYRLCNNIARDLERQKAYDSAIALYSGSQRHPGRERHARVLEQQGDLQAAQALCTEMLAVPWCEAEQEAAQRILARVTRKLGKQPVPAKRDAFHESQLNIPRGDGAVEVLTAQALQTHWREVHYVENSLMNTLFGLAFWEQIFAPVAGAFTHPYQAVPLDMYEAQFRTRRAAMLKKRLAQLQCADLETLLVEAYERYFGYQCHWVDWRNISADLVARTARTMPGKHLLEIWQRMLFDPRENRRGFPDLIAFGESAGDYCMIEVKGPGDTLQDSQKRWLRFFQQHDIPAQVAWVSWLEHA